MEIKFKCFKMLNEAVPIFLLIFFSSHFWCCFFHFWWFFFGNFWSHSFFYGKYFADKKRRFFRCEDFVSIFFFIAKIFSPSNITNGINCNKLLSNIEGNAIGRLFFSVQKERNESIRQFSSCGFIDDTLEAHTFVIFTFKKKMTRRPLYDIRW